MRKTARKFSALLLVMSIATLAWLVWLVYALLEPYPTLYAYSAVLLNEEQTPNEWYEPEQLDMMLTEINSTHLYCCAPSPNLHGLIIKYNGKFYKLGETPHIDYGPFGPNDFLKKTVPPTITVGFGWLIIGFILKRKEKVKFRALHSYCSVSCDSSTFHQLLQ